MSALMFDITDPQDHSLGELQADPKEDPAAIPHPGMVNQLPIQQAALLPGIPIKQVMKPAPLPTIVHSNVRVANPGAPTGGLGNPAGVVNIPGFVRRPTIIGALNFRRKIHKIY